VDAEVGRDVADPQPLGLACRRVAESAARTRRGALALDAAREVVRHREAQRRRDRQHLERERREPALGRVAHQRLDLRDERLGALRLTLPVAQPPRDHREMAARLGRELRRSLARQLERGARLVGAAEIVEELRAVEVRFAEPRVELDRALEARERGVDAPAQLVERAEVVERGCALRRGADRALVARDRVVDPPVAAQQVSELTPEIGVVRRGRERAVETRFGIGAAAAAQMRASERERSGREPWMKRERALERCLRGVIVAEIEQQRAEVVVRERVVGIALERVAIRSLRLGAQSQRAQRVAEVVVVDGLARPRRDRRAQELHGVCGLARVVAQDAQSVQRVRLVRRVPEHLFVERARLVEPPGPVQAARLVQCSGELARARARCHMNAPVWTFFGNSSGVSGTATSSGVGPCAFAHGRSLARSKPYRRAAFSPRIARVSASGLSWKVWRIALREFGNVPS
jgi:hypothetical protein